MIFRFSATYPYLPDDVKLYFRLSSIFWLLRSKIGLVKKIKSRQFRFVKGKENILKNSAIRGVINSNSFRNGGKAKVLLHVICVEGISVLHMEEKMISTDTKAPHSIKDMQMLPNDKEN